MPDSAGRPALFAVGLIALLGLIYLRYTQSAQRPWLTGDSFETRPDATRSSAIPARLPFPAYVIAVNSTSPRYLRTHALLTELGFDEIVPVAPRVHKLGNMKGDDEATKSARVGHRACSNKGAHRLV